jgi:hypothetical protein
LVDRNAPFHGNAFLGSAFQQGSMQGGSADAKAVSGPKQRRDLMSFAYKANTFKGDRRCRLQMNPHLVESGQAVWHDAFPARLIDRRNCAIYNSYAEP